MERLTEKTKNGYRVKDNDCSIRFDVLKLGKLEDLEDELGIPLEVLFKAFKEGIWTNYLFEVDESIEGKFNFRRLKLFNYKDLYLEELYHPYGDENCGERGICVKLKDYGKTWALTREELK